LLDRTFKQLEGVAPGTYLPDDAACFDPAEIEELAAILRRLLYAPSVLRKRLQQLGVSLVPANFYSEIPGIEAIEASFRGAPQRFDAVFEADLMARFLEELMPFAAEFDPPLDPQEGCFSWKGGPFSFSDAMAYYSIVRRTKPRRILEIGSGWSTRVAAMACARNGGGEILCIEPYPPDFLAAIPGVTLRQCLAQELDVAFFNETLADGDILFIDSTHTVKHGSDCIHLYLRVLPEIARRILVHAHDIFLPGTLPEYQLRDQQIYWTEQYLLYAYLLDNPRTQMLYGSEWHMQRNRDALTRFMHGRFEPGGASVWFSQEPRSI
jgi:predicted O-methyltransferase YrrM